MKLAIFSLVATVAIVIGIVRCGASSESVENALSKAMGAIAVTSPAATSSSSSASASLFGAKKTFSAFMQFTGISVVLRWMGLSQAAADETGKPTDIKPIGEKITEMKNSATADPATTAAAMGNPIEKKSFKALCYGPGLTDNAGGSNTSRPSGDLGIVWPDASNTDTRACAVAQVDALMAGAPNFFNNFIKMQGVMLSAANKAGKSLPAEGETEDLTSLMPTMTGITITNSDLIRLDTSDGSEIYKSVFEFTDSGSKTATVTIYHSPGNTDNTNFTGLAYATIPHAATMGGTGDKRFMSMVYSQADGVLTLSAKIMANRSTTSSDAFTAGMEVDFSKSTSAREDFHWVIGTLNSSTGAGSLHYAWQAGGADGATRTFAFNVAADGTGTAFAGFGPAISSLTTANAPWVTNMRCNWLDGVSNSQSTAKVQKQTLAKHTASGEWRAATSNIRFAPTNNCTKSGTWTISNATGATFLNRDITDTTTHDLQTPPTTTDVAVITAPTFTIPAGN